VVVQHTDSWDKAGTVEPLKMAALLVAAVVPVVDKVGMQGESAARPLGAGSASLRHVPIAWFLVVFYFISRRAQRGLCIVIAWQSAVHRAEPIVIFA